MNSEMGLSSKLRRLMVLVKRLRDDRRGACHWADLRRKLHMRLFLSSGCFVGFAVLCSERDRPFFVPSPAIRFPERAEGVKGPKR